MRSFIRQIPFLYRLNVFFRQHKFKYQESKIRRIYDFSSPRTAALEKVELQPRSELKSAFFVGTNELQDQSGLLRGLQTIFCNFDFFTKADGSYGLEFPKTHFSKEVVSRNTSRLKSVLEGKVALPDVLIGQMMGLNIDHGYLQSLRQKGVYIINISMDDRLPDLWMPSSGGYARGAIQLASGVDITLTTCSDRVSAYHSLGHRAKSMSLATDLLMSSDVIERDIDVSFVGNRYGVRGKLVSALQSAGVNVQAFGRGWPNGLIAPEATSKINARSRIVLGCGTVAHMEDVTTLKLRDFDSLASGACYVTHRDDDLLRFFNEDQHLVCFSTIGEMVNKVTYLLENPNYAQRIGQEGQQKVQREFLWQDVLKKTFLDIGLTIV